MRDGASGDEADQIVRSSFSCVVHEFAELSDGRRITLHEDRGFSGTMLMLHQDTGCTEPHDPWSSLTVEALERDVLTTVLPDDDETSDEHPWQ